MVLQCSADILAVRVMALTGITAHIRSQERAFTASVCLRICMWLHQVENVKLNQFLNVLSMTMSTHIRNI